LALLVVPQAAQAQYYYDTVELGKVEKINVTVAEMDHVCWSPSSKILKDLAEGKLRASGITVTDEQNTGVHVLLISPAEIYDDSDLGWCTVYMSIILQRTSRSFFGLVSDDVQIAKIEMPIHGFTAKHAQSVIMARVGFEIDVLADEILRARSGQ